MLRSGMEKRQGDGLDSASQSAVKLGRFLPCERFHLLIHVKTLMVRPPYKGEIFRSALVLCLGVVQGNCSYSSRTGFMRGRF
jgi:hypothetical protein